MAAESQNKRILYRAYQDIDAYLDDLYVTYKELYTNAARIDYSEALQDKHTFDYCRARKYFVLVIPYTNRREILVERSFGSNKLTWVLVGGSLRKDLTESFIDAASRHASRTVSDLELGEIEPVAFLENTFHYETDSHQHFGIAFVARVRNSDPFTDLRKTIHTRGHFIPYNEPSVPFSLSHNDKVMKEVRRYLDSADTSEALEFEVSENLKYKKRYAFHGAIIKPLFRLFGHLFKYSLQDLEQKTLSLLQDGVCEKILDVACGENTSVIGYGKQPGAQLVVGNDVSWSQIQLMGQNFTSKDFRNLGSMVLFTNHDACKLPFADNAFDFVICKNVLHHMQDLSSVECLIREVVRVGRRSLIIEILDPQFESLWGKMRHQYYLRFLHDAGRCFLGRLEFDAATDVGFEVNRFEMATIRGIYQFAYFGRKSCEESSATKESGYIAKPAQINYNRTGEADDVTERN